MEALQQTAPFPRRQLHELLGWLMPGPEGLSACAKWLIEVVSLILIHTLPEAFSASSA